MANGRGTRGGVGQGTAGLPGRATQNDQNMPRAGTPQARREADRLDESGAPLPRTEPPRAAEPTEEAIRLRAYERFLARNGGDGSPELDWIQAEQELRGEAGSRAGRGGDAAI